MPDHVKVSTPKVLWELIRQAHGPEVATDICTVSNEEPLLTVRANTIKVSRDELIREFTDDLGWKVVKTSFAPNGVRFVKPPEGNLFQTVQFKKGHFEIQDEASQLLAMRVDVKPKQTVLDYCGGSAGKTLAFAPLMHNTGQIYIHDIRKAVLLQAKQRLKRAGVQNAQVHSDKVWLRGHLKQRVDWLLLDVPCTGAGVMRKNPDSKYKFSLERLHELMKIQEMILEEGLAFLRDEHSRIVYCTCSILPEENILQVAKFCDKHGFTIENDEVFQTLPKSKGMDGFFSATLKPK
jgi:16S rRNA C967 or C1407 C5-methylase (RsmB/RsmF family)